MAKRPFSLVLLPALIATMLGCGGGSSHMMAPPPQSEFLYTIAVGGTINSPTFQLSSFSADASTGALSFTSTMPLSGIAPGIAVRRDSKFLYVSAPNPVANFIDIYSLDPTTGVPSPAGSVPLTSICAFCPIPSGPGALAMDPAGKSLYYGSSTIGAGIAQGVGALTSDSASGALTPVSGSPFPDAEVPFFVLVHPSGNFVYTENIVGPGPGGFALQSVSGYSLDPATGALAPVINSPFLPAASADAIGFVVHPSGKFIYASTGLAANGILGWNVNDATGELKDMPGSPFQLGSKIFGGTFDPTGNFLYASAGPSGGILGFSVDPNSGVLNPLDGSPFFTNLVPGGLVVDPAGRFLFAGDGTNSAITAFSRDSTTGALKAQVSTVSVGARPGFLSIAKAP